MLTAGLAVLSLTVVHNQMWVRDAEEAARRSVIAKTQRVRNETRDYLDNHRAAIQSLAAAIASFSDIHDSRADTLLERALVR